MKILLKEILCGFLFFMTVSMSFASDESQGISLLPVADYSFCTKAQTQHSVGLVSDSWALQFHFKNSDVENSSGEIKAKYMTYYEGPEIYRYIARSAGPIRPPVPDNEKYTKKSLENVVVAYERKESGVIFKVNSFEAHGKVYEIGVLPPLPCSHPLS